ncbi:MAG: DUF1622 domain-containing protein [Acidobacteriota bacterium]|nr:DUF1622 domain-containing protein [Acidobacteriota bacterium]
MIETVEWIMRGIEAAGIAVIVGGLALAVVEFFGSRRVMPFERAYQQLRRQIGRAILLGLEFLVAADIIGTVAVEPTLRSVGVLGLVVLVRTFLSMALEIEMEGRLPWRRQT